MTEVGGHGAGSPSDEAQDQGVAASHGGIAVGGNVQGPVVSGNQNVIHVTYQGVQVQIPELRRR